MKAPRLRAGIVLLAGVALFATLVTWSGVAAADEADLVEALRLYDEGNTDEALEKLRAYVASNPGEEEVYAVLRAVEERALLKVLTLQGEHETLMRYLLDRARPASRRDRPDESEIQRLAGHAVTAATLDQRRRAGLQLRAAGELAVPHLFPYLGSEEPEQVVNAIFAFHYLGWEATMALAEVLESDDARMQAYAAAVLGDLRDPRALPALLRLGQTSQDPLAQEKASAALLKLGGERALGIRAANAYTRLGERFYAQDPTIVVGLDDVRNVWRWEDGSLKRYGVPSYLYPYQMAEQMALDAIALEPGHRRARALLVRSLLAQKVEADVLRARGEGAEPPEALGGAFTLAASQGFVAASDALAASLQAEDWDIAVEATNLVAATYGAEALVGHPLGDALVAPERRVRYAAAIAALHMSPKHPLPNADAVASLAAQAASERAVRQILIIDDNLDTARRLVTDLAHRDAGFVAAARSTGAEGVALAKTSPMLDVVIVRADLGGDPMRTIPARRHLSSYQVIDELKADARTQGVRIVLLVGATPEGAADAVKAHFEEKYGEALHGTISVPIDTANVVEIVTAAAEAAELNPDRQRANELALRAAEAFAQTDFTCRSFDLLIAVEPLATAAASGPTPEVRLAAVRALGNIRVGGTGTLAQIVREAEEEEMRAAAASALGEVLSVVEGSPEDVQALVEAAKGEGAPAAAALQALGRVRALSPEQRTEIFVQHRLSVAQPTDE